MLAVHVPTAGQAPVLADLPVPEVGEGTVLIRVKAAGLNALDNAIAAGAMSEMIPHEYPLTLGRDAAGIVEAVGAGVHDVAVGDRVVGHVLLRPPLRHGALAEFALLPAEAVVPIPDGLDFATAAALPLAGAAAHAAVEGTEAVAGQVVLVNGATGGVGGYVVQLLAARGVTVIATGTAADVDRLTAQGASTVVDYTNGSVAEQVTNIHPAGVDALVELVAQNAESSPLSAVKRGGRVSTTTGHPDEATLVRAGVTGGTVMASPVGDVIRSLAAATAEGELVVDVNTLLSLEEALDGLATIAAGTARGKIVVTIGA